MVDNSLADDALDDDDTLREGAHAARPAGETEPATRHDVAEGGVLGAVGGAVVGMLAGGPVGAVIGAVVGGAASAGAVDVVDKHDHDYERTATGGDTAAPVAGASAVPATDASTGTVVVSAAAPGPAAEASVPAELSPVVAETGLVPVETAPVETAETTNVTARIRVRAYELYELRGRGDGQDVADWLEAERAVLQG